MSPWNNKSTLSREGLLIILLALVKLCIHFFTYDNFGLHRDAYLYYAQSEHLAWGFYEVPPFIALVGKLATGLFGNTVFGLRFFPALIGALNVVLLGLMVMELKGRSLAIILACLAYILSPAYLHVNTLFQPVAFNHFFWLLASWLILKMINQQNPALWTGISIVLAIGFLNKYSVLIFAASFFLAILISRHRRLIFSRYLLLGIGIGLLLVFPNLVWQYEHHWPVLEHMSELRRTQLAHVQLSNFITEQLLMNVQAVPLWLGGLLVLLFYTKEKNYRIFGFTFLFLLSILILAKGKSYYSLGVYPILFVFGGYFAEKYITKFRIPLSLILIAWMVCGLYFSLPFDGIPLSTLEQTLNKGAFRWEDGKYYDIPQDMADMRGWDQLGKSVVDIYNKIESNKSDNCHIYCYHYGQAGAIMFYGKEYDLPQPISFNGSFALWAPDSLSKDYVIWVHSPLARGFRPDTLLASYFDSFELKQTINVPYFREDGTEIYLCAYPKERIKRRYQNRIDKVKYRPK